MSLALERLASVRACNGASARRVSPAGRAAPSSGAASSLPSAQGRPWSLWVPVLVALVPYISPLRTAGCEGRSMASEAVANLPGGRRIVKNGENEKGGVEYEVE